MTEILNCTQIWTWKIKHIFLVQPTLLFFHMEKRIKETNREETCNAKKMLRNIKWTENLRASFFNTENVRFGWNLFYRFDDTTRSKLRTDRQAIFLQVKNHWRLTGCEPGPWRQKSYAISTLAQLSSLIYIISQEEWNITKLDLKKHWQTGNLAL